MGEDNVFNVNKVCNVLTKNEGKNGGKFTGKTTCNGFYTLYIPKLLITY